MYFNASTIWTGLKLCQKLRYPSKLFNGYPSKLFNGHHLLLSPTNIAYTGSGKSYESHSFVDKVNIKDIFTGTRMIITAYSLSPSTTFNHKRHINNNVPILNFHFVEQSKKCWINL